MYVETAIFGTFQQARRNEQAKRDSNDEINVVGRLLKASEQSKRGTKTTVPSSP